MTSSNPWRRLLDYLKDGDVPPLRMIHGMRHLVRKGVCCQVHSHRDLEIVYHARGNGVTRLEAGTEIPFQKGGVILYAPGQPHDQVMDGEGEDVCLQIEIPARLRRGWKGCLYVPPPLGSFAETELEFLADNRVRTELPEQTVLHLRATAALLSLIHATSASASRKALPRTERHVTQAESYFRTHFQTIASLQEVARSIGISHDRLRHLFQEHRGTSMIRRLNEIRLERACALLVHSRLAMKEIATLSGFRDEYYFSAVFRRFHHLSPSAYRETF